MTGLPPEASDPAFQLVLARALAGDQKAAEQVKAYFRIPKQRTPFYTGAGTECSPWCPEHRNHRR